MKSVKRSLFFLLPVALYLFCALSFLLASDSLYLDPADPAVSDRTRTATVEELRVDLNRVSYDELICIPNIGPKLAEQIIQYRLEHGGFRNVKELDRIPGIGEKKLKILTDYVYVEE